MNTVEDCVKAYQKKENVPVEECMGCALKDLPYNDFKQCMLGVIIIRKHKEKQENGNDS